MLHLMLPWHKITSIRPGLFLTDLTGHLDLQCPGVPLPGVFHLGTVLLWLSLLNIDSPKLVQYFPIVPNLRPGLIHLTIIIHPSIIRISNRRSYVDHRIILGHPRAGGRPKQRLLIRCLHPRIRLHFSGHWFCGTRDTDTDVTLIFWLNGPGTCLFKIVCVGHIRIKQWIQVVNSGSFGDASFVLVVTIDARIGSTWWWQQELIRQKPFFWLSSLFFNE